MTTFDDATHTITVELDANGARRKFACRANEGASCRRTCADGCEDWNDAEHEHTMIDAGHCLILEWFENDGAADELLLGSYEIFSGSIAPHWNGGGYDYELVSTEAECDPAFHEIARDRGASFCAECGTRLVATALPSPAVIRAVAAIDAVLTQHSWKDGTRTPADSSFGEGLKRARQVVLTS
jgi:hypothetical protein